MARAVLLDPYVIDKKGVVKHVHRGYHDGEDAELEKEIKALF